MYDEIRDQLMAYYQQELHYTKVGLANEADLIERGNIYQYTLQRCLGACQFAQMMGLPFEIAELLFEAMRINLEEFENGG